MTWKRPGPRRLPPLAPETEGRVTPPAPPTPPAVRLATARRARRRPDRVDRARPARPPGARARADAPGRARSPTRWSRKGSPRATASPGCWPRVTGLPLVDLRLTGVSAEASVLMPPARPPPSGRAALPARGRDAARRDRGPAERAGDRRAEARDSLPVVARSRRVATTSSPNSTDRPSPGGGRGARSRSDRTQLCDPRPRGGGRRLRGARRSHRQLDHAPGGRGWGKRRALRGAGGGPRRQVPHRRRPAWGAARSRSSSPRG